MSGMERGSYLSGMSVHRPALLLAALLLGAALPGSPWTPGSPVGVAPLVAQEPPSCPAAGNSATERGWEAYRADDMAAAARAFREALALCPGHPGAATGSGYVALREDRLDDAVAAFEAVLALEEGVVDAWVGVGLAAWRTGDLDRTREAFLRVQTLDPAREIASDYLARIPPGVGPPPERPPLVLPDTLVLAARTLGDRFQVPGLRGWEDFWIKGMNLGAALPGRNPSDFPGREVYEGWLAEMARMNVNTIRAYTIHPPHFYEALAEHNARNPERPLWLVHGVWTELPEGDDFLGEAYEGEFFDEIRRVVDLLHGRADIRPRPGHASGFYTADVSRWTLGYILGREWEPHAVSAFDSIRPDFRGYEGRFVRVEGGNAMDAWLARAVDTLVAYETERYRVQRPVAWTNWPTLDPMHHPSESTRDEEVAIRLARGEAVFLEPREYDNDGIGIDPSLLRATEAFRAGVFAAYHAYPYYPDLFILSERYDGAASSLGPSHYMGYLRELKAHHRDLPLVIAEYGVPASLGPAHLQPQGWHHGGHTEEEMAQVNRRLTLELAEAGMAGGMLFAWIDEWFKKNWLVIEYELPPERNRLWYNRLDAEQHYGMFALEAEPAVPGETLEERLEAWRGCPPLHEGTELTVRAAHDAAHLWLLLETPERRAGDRLMVGLDILDPEAGERRWPGAPEGPPLPAGIEFVVVDDGDEVRVLVHPPYNPFRLVEVGQGGSGPTAPEIPIEGAPPGFFRARMEQWMNVPFATLRDGEATVDGAYDSLRVIPNRRRFTRDGVEHLAMGYDRGVLREGPPPDGQFERREGVLELRIPWLLVNVTDPSSRSVLTSPGGDPDGLRRTAAGRIPAPSRALRSLLDTLSGGVGTAAVEDIGIVAGLRRADGSWVDGWGAGGAPRFRWPGWDEPRWRARERPVFQVMARTFAELDPYADSGTPAMPPPSAADTLQERADAAWRAGETEEAERLYRLILQASPDDTRALHRVALVSAWTERIDEGIGLLDRLLGLEPGNVEAAVDRARFRAWQGRLEEALAELEALDRAHPSNPRVLEELARIRGWAGDFDRAASTWDALLGITPGDPAVLRERARAQGLAQDFAAARASWVALLEQDPGDIEARLGLARLLAFSDRLDESVAQYDAALVTAPGNPEALAGKGRTLAWAGRLVEAEGVLRDALASAPAEAEIRSTLAQVLTWQGRRGAAVELLEEGERLTPGRRDLAEQRRRIEAEFRPALRSSVALEGDSDDNRMNTVSLAATATSFRRLTVRADVYRRFLEAEGLEREASGGQVTASLLLEPGWTVGVGGGTAWSDAPGSTDQGLASFSLASPGRYPLVVSADWNRSALDATALLAQRGVRVDAAEVGLRWAPAPGWSVQGSAGRALFVGQEENERLSGSLALGRRLSGGWTMGVAGRAYAFDRRLFEGYFSPERFQLGEGTIRWLRESGGWSLQVEGAAGAQRIEETDPAAVLRTSLRLAFRPGPGREFHLGGGFSTAGVQAFASGEDYRYAAVVAGISWAF